MSDCPCITYDTSDLNMPSVVHDEMRTARKRHTCCECGDPIQPGERYEHVRGLWDGQWSAYRTCAACSDVRSVVMCGGWTFTDLWHDLRASCLLTPTAPPQACVLRELTEAGAAKLKEQWMEMVEAE